MTFDLDVADADVDETRKRIDSILSTPNVARLISAYFNSNAFSMSQCGCASAIPTWNQRLS